MEEDGGCCRGTGKSKEEVGDGSGGSLSSPFKRKVSLTELETESESELESCMYVGDGGIPLGKRALYNYPEDSMLVQEMYGLTSEAELGRLVNSTRTKDDDIVSPNLRFTYGVEPYARDSDPRIGSMARQKQQALHMVESSCRAAIVRRRPEDEGKPLSSQARKVMEIWQRVSGKPADFKAPAHDRYQELEIWKKKYEKWEEQEQELLHGRDLRMATRGLACFNLKYKTDYMVEQVLGSQKIDLEKGCFYHCNFKARSKKGSSSQPLLFFAELRNSVSVTVCCILDDDAVRGCHFCGDEFVHPSEKSLLSAGC